MSKTLEELTRCGLDCEVCHIYRKTVYREPMSSDVLLRWQTDLKKYWDMDSVTEEQLICHGCRSKNSEDLQVLKKCPIRSCCISKGLISCGLCLELFSCPNHDIQEGKENLAKATRIRV